MTKPEELYYYKKSAELYEVVLDGKYGGFYDVPLVSDYANIASILVEIGKREEAESYLERIFSILEKHLTKEKQEKSELLYATYIPNTVPAEKNCIKLMEEMIANTTDASVEKHVPVYEKVEDTINVNSSFAS